VRFERCVLPLPVDERAPAPGARGSAGRRGRSIELRLGFGGDDGAPPLLGLRLELPAPVLADEDGDGALDLLALDGDRLIVWRQRRADGPPFVASPDVVATAPLAPGEERRLDPSFGVETRDLDGDRRADFLLCAGDRRASEPRTQLLVWRGSEPGDPFAGGKPSELLVLGGIARMAELVDVDGNGAPDLVCTVLRTDRLGALDFLGDDDVTTELDVFLNEKGRLGPRAALVCELRVGEEAFGAPARFVRDVTGDGIAELLVREGSGRLLLRRIARRDGGLALDRPLWELEGGLDEDARLVFAEDALPRAVLIVEERGLRLVSFR
jgi:hypothetical protein